MRSKNSRCYFESFSKVLFLSVFNDVAQEKQIQNRILSLNERLANSEIFIQASITQQKIKEYYSIYETPEEVQKIIDESDNPDFFFLEKVYIKDRENLRQFLLFDNLQKHYDEGETKISCEYRRHVPDGSYRWFCITIVFVEDPSIFGSVDAVAYAHDIHEKMQIRIAKDKVIDSDIDHITIIEIKTGIANVLKLYKTQK